MSCALVSDTLISALLTGAARYDKHRQIPAPNWAQLALDHPQSFGRVASINGTVPNGSNVAKTYPSELGRALALVNVASVEANYQGRHTDASDVAEALAFRIEPVDMEPAALLRQVHYYAYQSCEAPGWDDGWAKAFCTALEGILIQNLPGYIAAPWGV